jgi:hypothetical protein
MTDSITLPALTDDDQQFAHWVNGWHSLTLDSREEAEKVLHRAEEHGCEERGMVSLDGSEFVVWWRSDDE